MRDGLCKKETVMREGEEVSRVSREESVKCFTNFGLRFLFDRKYFTNSTNYFTTKQTPCENFKKNLVYDFLFFKKSDKF